MAAAVDLVAKMVVKMLPNLFVLVRLMVGWCSGREGSMGGSFAFWWFGGPLKRAEEEGGKGLKTLVM